MGTVWYSCMVQSVLVTQYIAVVAWWVIPNQYTTALGSTLSNHVTPVWFLNGKQIGKAIALLEGFIEAEGLEQNAVLTKYSHVDCAAACSGGYSD